MITLKVTPDDGAPYTVTATSRDVLAWEKTTGSKKSFVDLINDPTLADLYRVAHLACWRQGLFTGTQKDFEASCEVTGGVEDDEPDPTPEGVSTEPSSPSPSEPGSAPRSGRRKANAQS
jgi:hypothetical protein